MTTTTTMPALLTVDPTTLTVRDQARSDATPDDALVTSIRENGILQPPTVACDPDDPDVTYIVFGHRRVGAAILAGLPEITVLQISHADAVTKLRQQLVENERREQMTPTDVARGWKSMQLFGATVEEIAAQTGEKPERVRAGLTIVDSEKALAAAQTSPDLDLEQLAVLAEFADDEKLTGELAEAMRTRPGNVDYKVAAARTKRRNKQLAEQYRAELIAEGVTVVKAGTDGRWWQGKDGKGLTIDRGMYTAEGAAITAEDHTACPGHVAAVYDPGSYGTTEILYACTDWQGNGHLKFAPRVEDPEAVARREEFERRQQERAARDARRKAAQDARLAWVREHITTGRLRPTAAHFDLVADAIRLTVHNGPPCKETLELLTGEPYTGDHWATPDVFADHIADRTSPALRVIIANAIAAHEYDTDPLGVVRYYDFLAEVGYTRSDVDDEILTEARQDIANAEAADDEEVHYEPGDEDPVPEGDDQ